MSTKSFYGIGQGSFYGGGMYGNGQPPVSIIEKELGPASIISFNDGIKNKPLKECVVDIEPAQSGSGDPSENNIRPLIGFTGVILTISPTTDSNDGTGYVIMFPANVGAIYGGTLNVTTGMLTVDRGYKRFDGTEIWRDGAAGVAGYSYFLYKIGEMDSGVNDSGVCSHFLAANVRAATSVIGQRVVNSTAGELRLCVRPNNFESYTPETFKAWVAEQAQNGTPLEIMWELAVPQTYQLTPMQIKALIGENNIWADTGDITIKYLAKK